MHVCYLAPIIRLFSSVVLAPKLFCKLNLCGILLINLPHAETRRAVRSGNLANLIRLLMQVSKQFLQQSLVWFSLCGHPESKQGKNQSRELLNLNLLECKCMSFSKADMVSEVEAWLISQGPLEYTTGRWGMTGNQKIALHHCSFLLSIVCLFSCIQSSNFYFWFRYWGFY